MRASEVRAKTGAGWRRLQSALKAKSPTIAWTPRDYWTSHTVVADPKWLEDRTSSLECFWWRCNQYPGYLELMPVSGHDGLDVLDYGCGPGHDLVGIGTYSQVRSLTGVDVSATALEYARKRLALDPRLSEVRALFLESDFEIPLAAASVDYVHSSGVLHHVPDLLASLREIRRVLRDHGRVRIMVYNRNSLWWHLYAPYVLQVVEKSIPGDWSDEDAFRASTDGPECPVSRAYTVQSFAESANAAGFDVAFVGTAISNHELAIWEQYGSRALSDERLSPEHAKFLRDLVPDADGRPCLDGAVAGINLVLDLVPRPVRGTVETRQL